MEIIQLLLGAGADPLLVSIGQRKRKDTALHSAVWAGHEYAVSAFLSEIAAVPVAGISFDLASASRAKKRSPPSAETIARRIVDKKPLNYCPGAHERILDMIRAATPRK